MNIAQHSRHDKWEKIAHVAVFHLRQSPPYLHIWGCMYLCCTYASVCVFICANEYKECLENDKRNRCLDFHSLYTMFFLNFVPSPLTRPPFFWNELKAPRIKTAHSKWKSSVDNTHKKHEQEWARERERYSEIKQFLLWFKHEQCKTFGFLLLAHLPCSSEHDWKYTCIRWIRQMFFEIWILETFSVYAASDIRVFPFDEWSMT
jgi:hypothetical protein